MHITCASRTDVGLKRSVNEDALAVLEERGLYAVADGMGGHAAGRLAAEIASAELLRHVARAPGEPSAELLRSAFRVVNDAVRARAHSAPEYRGMGTTLAALWIRAERAVLAHVGDSRIYVFRAGSLHQLTLDHSLVAELVLRGQLDAEAARTHPQRNVITRALGVRPGLEPDISEIRVLPEDVFLVCSDGLTGPVEDREIACVLGEADDDLSGAVDTLIDLANDRGGEDNATVVLVRVGER